MEVLEDGFALENLIGERRHASMAATYARLVGACLVACSLYGSGSSLGHAERSPQFGTPVRIGFARGDDWEPAIAADRFGHLYAVFAHADPNGPYKTRLMTQVSSDVGRTWSAPAPIARPPSAGSQFDPWIAVHGANGRTISIAFLQGYPNASVDVVTSTDFGRTWSAPKRVTTLPPPLDKPVLVSRGSLMAVAFTDYAVNIWAAISHDGGAHWTTHRIANVGSPVQLLTAGGGIDSLGNIYFAWNGYYPQHQPGPSRVWMTKSSDGGATWTRTDIGVSGAPKYCKACADHEYFAAQMAMQVGADDHIYLLWNSTRDLTNFAPERIYFSRSTNHGSTYAPRRDVSGAAAGVEHCFPALVAGSTPGDVRIAWMDRRNGPWNVFYRASTNGGQTFSPETRLSTYVPGYGYLKRDGFSFPYGDYFQLAIDTNGRTHADFGESEAITTPGNAWIANQLP
jgi:hypothetical protein